MSPQHTIRSVMLEFDISQEDGGVTLRGEDIPFLWLPAPIPPTVGYLDLKQQVLDMMQDLWAELTEEG